MDWNQTEAHIKKTGEWWVNPWWLRTDFVEVIPRTEDQIKDAIEYLKSIFPASWAKEFQGSWTDNVFIRSVLYWTAFSRAHLILLSERLQRLKAAPGIHVVINALRGKQGSDAADMELEFGDFFFQKRLEIEFPIPKSSKGKTPDIRIISGGHRLAVECKQLKVAKVSSFIQDAYIRAGFKLNEVAEKRNIGWHFQFYDETINEVLSLYSAGKDCAEFITRWGERIADQLDLAVKNDRWPVWIFMEGLGEGMFYQSSDGDGSTTRSPDTPDELLFRRLLSNALAPAAEQLANQSDPGLVAISVPHLPDNEYLSQETNKVFERNKEQYGNIVAVLVIPWQPWFYKDPPRLVLNRHAHAKWSDEINAVIQKLEAVVV
jgi:hypothetical protein